MSTDSNGLSSLFSALAADLEQAANRVRASVVEVRTSGHGAGAGTIWSPSGTIVTNHHVAPAERAAVRLADGRELGAVVTARDVDNDLAVLSVDARGLPAIQPGDARRLRPGEIVFAIGHPFGVTGALTLGVVSSAHVQVDGHRELVRADVALGPGNSGGPLVDARGRVVGINAMVNGGLALAVPAHIVERLAAGSGRRVLGVAVRDVEIASTRAALVTGVRSDGPADRAGVLVGDAIVAIDGEPVQSGAALVAALAHAERDVVQVRVLRGGVQRTLTVTLEGGDVRAAA